MKRSWIPVGELQLLPVSGGQLWIDGGSMFGMVPRMMWQRFAEPDSQHRVLVETNCFVVRTPTSLGIIDSGYGGKAGPKVRQRMSMEDGMPLVRNLAEHGIVPDQIDWVILSHLHFDHVGGCVARNASGRLEPVFRRARHIIQHTEWADATGKIPELVGSYFADDIVPLSDAGLVEQVDGTTEIVPGVTVTLTGGHTRGHQSIALQSGEASAIFAGDICPTAAHLPTFWTLSYDQFPLTVRRLKASLFDNVIQHDRLLLFSHDPVTPAVRLMRSADGQVVAHPVS
ncbi:MBL fold metallo-hydrolase [Rosistilla oblonga]|uniref:MBL fold metallo-hydrolase n=1 Tax=Rosistilla oblonga TaxID=2527990 RepID=UPI003A96AF23